MTDTERGSALPWKKIPGSSPTELSVERGTGVLSHAAEQDACLLNENGSDQSMYSCPSPTDEGGDDLENMAASPPLQVWFDTEVSEALEREITWMWLLQLVSVRKQRSDQMFKSSVDTRKVESEFTVKNVTELIVDNGQQADDSRKTWLNDVDGLTRCMKSPGRIERLLRNARSFGELWNQKGECAIPCDMHLCSFCTLSEQESGPNETDGQR